LIYAFIIIGFCLLVFMVNYTLKPERKIDTELKIKNNDSLKINFNTKENRTFILDMLNSSKLDTMEYRKETPKPTPPPSQLIKEGQDPKPRPSK